MAEQNVTDISNNEHLYHAESSRGSPSVDGDCVMALARDDTAWNSPATTRECASMEAPATFNGMSGNTGIFTPMLALVDGDSSKKPLFQPKISTFFSPYKPYLTIWSIVMSGRKGIRDGTRIIQVGCSKGLDDFKPSQSKLPGETIPNHYRLIHWRGPGALSDRRIFNPDEDVLFFEDFFALEKLFAVTYPETQIGFSRAESNPWYTTPNGHRERLYLEDNVRWIAIGYSKFKATPQFSTSHLRDLTRFVKLERISVNTSICYGEDQEMLPPRTGYIDASETLVKKNFLKCWTKARTAEAIENNGLVQRMPEPGLKWLSPKSFNSRFMARRSTEVVRGSPKCPVKSEPSEDTPMAQTAQSSSSPGAGGWPPTPEQIVSDWQEMRESEEQKIAGGYPAVGQPAVVQSPIQHAARSHNPREPQQSGQGNYIFNCGDIILHNGNFQLPQYPENDARQYMAMPPQMQPQMPNQMPRHVPNHVPDQVRGSVYYQPPPHYQQNVDYHE